MSSQNPKYVRGRILQILYEHFLDDPMKMLTPEDILGDESIERKILATSAIYLHERGLIELAIGYAPPLFTSAKISPDGVDLVENEDSFRREFSDTSAADGESNREATLLMVSLAKEAELSPLQGLQREWLYRDLTHLRDELRRPVDTWRQEVILRSIGWIRGYFDGDCDRYLASLSRLENFLDVRGDR
ncbi:MAG: hypothetical protein IID08_01915 [Candidatus Hydrogenedentes bacterium]|nr:hypothetical protein [Candidatus Hydrogenedentota bacterium]